MQPPFQRLENKYKHRFPLGNYNAITISHLETLLSKWSVERLKFAKEYCEGNVKGNKLKQWVKKEYSILKKMINTSQNVAHVGY